MQYVIIFIVILIVMVVMNLFLYLGLQSTVQKIREQVDAYFTQKLEFLDELYEEKSERLRQIQAEESQYLRVTRVGHAQGQEKEPLKKKELIPAGKLLELGTQPGKKAGYVNADFIRDYRYVREHFQVDVSEAVKEVQKLPADAEALHYGRVCRHMYEILDFDVVYRLGLLSVEDQHEILFEMFDDEEDEVLRSYDREHPNFLIVEFRDYLKMESELNREELLVRVGTTETLPDMKVAVEQDSSIGEGARIYCGNKMYDYSI